MAKYYKDRLTLDRIFSDKYPYREIENGMLLEVQTKFIFRKEHSENCYGDDDPDCDCDLYRKERPPIYDRNQLLTFIKVYIMRLAYKLEGQDKVEFVRGISGATKFLRSKLNILKFFDRFSMDKSLVMSYSKDGATEPTFLYFAHGLEGFKRPRKDVTVPLITTQVENLVLESPSWSLVPSSEAMYHDLLTDYEALCYSMNQAKPSDRHQKCYNTVRIYMEGDVILSDSFPYKEIEAVGGLLWEVEGKMVDHFLPVRKKRKLNDEANQAVKLIDIVDTFDLKGLHCYDQDWFLMRLEEYKVRLGQKLDREKKELFEKGFPGAIEFLHSQYKNITTWFQGASGKGSWIFECYKDGATNPTFVYFSHCLKRVEVPTMF